jgi:Cytochrome c oxidase subunit VIIc
MSLVARTSVLQRQVLHSRVFVPSRGAHGYKVSVHAHHENATTIPRRSPPTPFKHMPFNYEGSKAVFGAKVAVFLLTGFSVPMVASYYQLYVKDRAFIVLSDLQSQLSVGNLREVHRFPRALCTFLDVAFS